MYIFACLLSDFNVFSGDKLQSFLSEDRLRRSSLYTSLGSPAFKPVAPRSVSALPLSDAVAVDGDLAWDSHPISPLVSSSGVK